MRIIFESLFDILYLLFAIGCGVYLLTRRQSSAGSRQLGWMALILGGGDAFHLLPRVWGFWHGGLEHFTVALGIGKFVTSITMTIFYVLLLNYLLAGRKATLFRGAGYALAAIRVGLCLLPQNAWLSARPPLEPAIWRNLPFLFLGLIVMVLAWQKGERRLGLWVFLSFAFYLPVVLWAEAFPTVGLLMIPKTVCYVLILVEALKLSRRPEESCASQS